MDINQNTFELIDRFLDSELNLQEKENFLKQLKNDIALQDEVSIQSELRKAIKVNSIEPLKKKLDGIRDRVRSEENVDTPKKEAKIIPLFWRLSIAAGILLLIGFFGQRFLLQEITPDGYKMVASKKVNPDYISETRSFNTNEKSAIKIRLLQSNISSTEQPTYVFQDSQLDIFTSAPSIFNGKKLTIIYFEDVELKVYLKSGIKLYQIFETSDKIPLVEEKNKDVKARILED